MGLQDEINRILKPPTPPSAEESLNNINQKVSTQNEQVITNDLIQEQLDNSPLTDSELRATPVPISGTVEVDTYLRPKVDNNNSSSTPLASGATFTGATTDISTYPAAVVSYKTNQNGTLYIEFSTDGANWDTILEYTVYEGKEESHRVKVLKKYFRIRLTNTSASAQTYLRLQTLLTNDGIITSTLNSTVYDDADAQLVRPLDFNLMVAEDLYYNKEIVTKDGYTPSMSSGSVTQDLWTESGAYTGFVSATDSAELVVAGADTGTVYYYYMATDTDTQYTLGSKAITGAGTYSLNHNIWRCNQMYFEASTTTVFNVGKMTIRHTATPANVFATIEIGLSQSYCSAYTVPYNSDVYVDRWQASVRGGSSGTSSGYAFVKFHNKSPRLEYPFEAQFGALFFDDINYLLKLPSRTDIIPRIVNNSNNNLIVKVSYRLIKVKK